MRVLQPLGPGRLRTVRGRRIGHRADEAANPDAVENIGHPHEPGEDHRQREPIKFGCHDLSPALSTVECNSWRQACRLAPQFQLRTFTYEPGASSIGRNLLLPILRAGTISAP